MNIVFDLLLIFVIGFAGWLGYKKGLVSGVVGIVMIIIAFYVGNLIANTYSYEFTSMAKPFLSGYVDQVLGEAAEEQISEDMLMYSVDDIIDADPEMTSVLSTAAFTKMGIYKSEADHLSKAVYLQIEEGKSLATAMVEALSSTLAFLFMFAIIFILLMIIIAALSNLIHLSFKIPGYPKQDKIGGAVLGITQGVIYAFLLAWLFSFLGIVLFGEAIGKTFLLKFFMTINPVSSILGL